MSLIEAVCRREWPRWRTDISPPMGPSRAARVYDGATGLGRLNGVYQQECSAVSLVKVAKWAASARLRVGSWGRSQDLRLGCGLSLSPRNKQQVVVSVPNLWFQLPIHLLYKGPSSVLAFALDPSWRPRPAAPCGWRSRTSHAWLAPTRQGHRLVRVGVGRKVHVVGPHRRVADLKQPAGLECRVRERHRRSGPGRVRAV